MNPENNALNNIIKTLPSHEASKHHSELKNAMDTSEGRNNTHKLYNKSIDRVNSYMNKLKSLGQKDQWVYKRLQGLQQNLIKERDKHLKYSPLSYSEQEINDLAHRIDNAENELLENLKNLQQKNALQTNKTALDQASKQAVDKSGKQAFDVDWQTGALNLRAGANTMKLDDLLKYLPNKNTIYEADYTNITNENIKNKIQTFLGVKDPNGRLRGYIRHDPQNDSYILINNRGEQMKPMIREGLKITTGDVSSLQTELQNFEQGVKEKQEQRNKSYTNLNDATIKANIDAFGDKLKKEIGSNAEIQNEIIAVVEKRLDAIIQYAKKHGYELHTTPVSKQRIGDDTTEIHLINSHGAEVNVPFLGNEKLSPQIINFLENRGSQLAGMGGTNSNVNRNELLREYISNRLQSKWQEAAHLTKRENIFAENKTLKSNELMTDEQKQSIRSGLNLLKPMLDSARQAEGDSYIDNDDNKYVALQQYVENVLYSLDTQTHVSKEELQTIINKISKQWHDLHGLNDEKNVHLKTFTTNFTTLLTGTKDQQISALRTINDTSPFLYNTHSSFLKNEIAEQKDFGLKQKEFDEAFKNIDASVSISEEEFERMHQETGGIDQNNPKIKLINTLYSAKNYSDIIKILYNNKLLPDSKLRSKDFQKELKEKCTSMQEQLAKQKQQFEQYTVSFDQYKKGLVAQRNELKKLSNPTPEQAQQLAALEYALEHPEEVQKALDYSVQQMKDMLQYGNMAGIIKGSLTELFVLEGGGATGSNAHIYNDIVGVGLFDLSDANKKLLTEIAIQVAIAIAVSLATAGAGATLVSGLARTAAFFGNNSTALRIAMTLTKISQHGLKAWGQLNALGKTTLIGSHIGSAMVEATLFNTLASTINNFKGGQGFDTIDIRPRSKANVQTAFFAAILPFADKFTTLLQRGTSNMIRIPINPDTIWSKVGKEVSQFGINVALNEAMRGPINVVFGPEEFDLSEGAPSITEQVLQQAKEGYNTSFNQEDIIKMMAMTIGFRMKQEANLTTPWSKLQRQFNAGTIKLCRTKNRNEVALFNTRSNQVTKITMDDKGNIVTNNEALQAVIDGNTNMGANQIQSSSTIDTSMGDISTTQEPTFIKQEATARNIQQPEGYAVKTPPIIKNPTSDPSRNT